MRVRGVVVRLVSVACVLVLGLALSGSVAVAGMQRGFLGSFGSFSNVESLAVDQATGDVFVYDAGASGGAVYKFNAAGEPAEFSSTHTNVIEGVGSAGSNEEEIAVDGSAGPTSGNIYVANNSGVRIYAATGVAAGELNGGGPWQEPCGVAVDPSGTVYVGLYPTHVNKYVPAPGADTVTNADYVSSLSGLEGICNIAVDSAGSVYADPYSGVGSIRKYDALQFSPLEISAVASGGSRGEGPTLAADFADDSLYVDNRSEVRGYDSSGSLLEVFAASGAGALGHSMGIAVSQSSGEVYVSTGQGVEGFGPPLTVPDETTGLTSALTGSGATLHGSVNPDGIAAQCRFEYGTSTAYGSSAPCAQDPGSGSAPVPVTADLTGLEPGTLYHYRLDASNANGEAHGLDLAFRTPGAPSIDGESVGSVRSDGATLRALVDAKGADTTYRFEYGTDTSYGTSVPAPDANIGSLPVEQSVHQTVSGLQPSTVYHYRVVASNTVGTVEAQDGSFTTAQAPASGGGGIADACPNAQARAEQRSAFLPDCRAYELASPVDKAGGEIGARTSRTRAASGLAAGEAMAVQFASSTAFGDAAGTGDAVDYMALRDARAGTQGWSTHAITPVQQPTTFKGAGFDQEPRYEGEFSEDLSTGVFTSWSSVTDAPNVKDVPNLYLRDDLRTPGAGSYQLLTDCLSPPLGPCSAPLKLNEHEYETILPYRPYLDGTSSDFGRILFESSLRLTNDSTAVFPVEEELGTRNVYEWDHGVVRLAGILPDGAPAPNSQAGQGKTTQLFAPVRHTFSSDGRTIIFTERTGSMGIDAGASGRLFMRVDNGSPDAYTVQVNASERTDCADHDPCSGTPEPDPNGATPASYQDASSDGSRVFFTTDDALTNNAVRTQHEQGSGGNLYMYNRNAAAGHHLTLLSFNQEPGSEHGGVDGVLGRSDDGKYVYFLDQEQLVAGQPSIARKSEGDRGVFLWHDDGNVGSSLSYIGTAHFGPRSDSEDVGLGRERADPVRVTPDGRDLLFRSMVGSVFQVYLYSADSGGLVCVSCSPDGAPTTQQGSDINEDTIGLGPAKGEEHLNHAVSDDGRYVFFSTAEALVPQDVNGQSDAYEYDSASGEVHLLSSGVDRSPSYFVDASRDGRDVFILTRQRLVGWDVDSQEDLYDVRVDGGFPNPVATPACSGDACQGQPSVAGAVGIPSSSLLAGAGNTPGAASRGVVVRRRAPVCRRGFVRRRVKGRLRCVARKRGRAARRGLRAGVVVSVKSASRRAGR